MLNRQRDIIYEQRRSVLEASVENEKILKEDIFEKLENAISMIVNVKTQEVLSSGNTADEAIVEEFSTIIPFDENSKNQIAKQLEQVSSIDGKSEILSKLTKDLYEKEKRIQVRKLQGK